MAKDTDLTLYNKTIYQVFPRQYSSSHNFKGVEDDLARIKDLGSDILYLLPIHPIGQKDKKGKLGCPYSVADYSKILDELGNKKDLKSLIDKTHALGMKIIIDVVYNHTSRDSYLLSTRPDFFVHDENNNIVNKVADWSDVADLNYENKELHKVLISYLVKWTKLGIDGFRCDVCSLVPFSFWKKARRRLQKINPNLIMLGETVDKGFVKWLKSQGYPAMNDNKVLELFDVIYDYDIRPYQEKFLKGEISVNKYLLQVSKQLKSIKGIKARYICNHDLPRVASYKDDKDFVRQATALTYFIKGTNFVYAGDETATTHLPSLFDYDEVDWSDYNKYNIVDLLKTLISLKKNEIFKDGTMEIIKSPTNVAIIKYTYNETVCYGIFNFTSKRKKISLPIKDIDIVNVINNQEIHITDSLSIKDEPIIFFLNN
ncbi:MAG: alpha-amylase family glycosyl hydrolase [Bacilli bacterium]